jgi:flagellar biosynthesis/type III secretory pathway M-ring protein FliF/YscJ
MGSYLEFAMEQPGTFRLTTAEGEDGIIIIVVGAGICAAILAIILIRKIRKSRKRRKTSVSSK